MDENLLSLIKKNFFNLTVKPHYLKEKLPLPTFIP
jgi:hypothetical protein